MMPIHQPRTRMPPSGTRNERGRSGSTTRKRMTAAQTIANATAVPRLIRSPSRLIGRHAASKAMATPV